MTYALIVWTVVGFAKHQSADVTKMDWRQLALFQDAQLCHEAARQLVYDPKNYRCIRTQ
jgi:hypothetical protein